MKTRNKLGRKGNIISAAVAIFIVAAAAVWFYFNPNADNAVKSSGFKLTAVDIGQGDSIFIQCNGKNMLVDSGPVEGEDDLIKFLQSKNIKKLDYVLVTHQHADHIGGMPEVLKNFDVDRFIMYELPEQMVPTSKAYKKLLQSLLDYNITVKAANDMVGESFMLGDAKITVLGPIDGDSDNLNNLSVVTRVEYGDTAFILSGDAEKEEEKDIIKSGAELSADVYKVGHHGSKTSSTNKYLEAINPKYALISAGNDNSYNHPSEKTLEKLSEKGIEYYITKEDGDITVTSDGTNIKVETEK